MARSQSRLPFPNKITDMCLDWVTSRAALMRARRVCRAMQSAVNHRFDIARMLSRFVRDVVGLRQIQANIGAVFSGSQVMNFFDGANYASDSDLDIFLRPGTALVLGNHLQAIEGYVYLGTAWVSDVATEPTEYAYSEYDAANVRRVYKFGKGRLRIDLVACTHCPIQSILSFHCTPIVNGMLWDRAFSCFAKAAWEFREGMVLERGNAAVEKYRSRSFKINDARISLGHHFGDRLRTGHRYIGDSDTWVLSLDTSGITPPARNIVLEHYSFSVVGLPTVSGRGVLGRTEYRINTVCFDHSLLAGPCAVAPLLWRFADTVMSCVRAQCLFGGHSFGPRIMIETDMPTYRRVESWDVLFVVVCTAWRTCVPLTLTLGEATATFYPLGGMAFSSHPLHSVHH